jgi:hypothetical protein
MQFYNSVYAMARWLKIIMQERMNNKYDFVLMF